MFQVWTEYAGKLAEVVDSDVLTGAPMKTSLYGWETFSDPQTCVGEVPAGGAIFGYVTTGAVTLWDPENRADGVLLREGRWFALPDEVRIHVHPDSRVVAVQRHGFRGVRAFGGPIEPAGRLRYIDGCSDTLLVGPPLLGDPCLNHLHFPTGIEQTMHTHPSVRCGAIARGLGICDTPDGKVALVPGSIWMIPTDGHHRFITEDASMDVIAYHPDSDWGPTDDAHPMLNRTWVDGASIDNSGEQHDPLDLVR